MKEASENNSCEMTEEVVAFISHSSKDAEKAQQIAYSLEKKGLRCWIAPRDIRPGKEYGEEIIYGIRDCRCLVLLLSEAANQSIHVRNEVERAVSYGKAVFPIRIEEVLPSPALELSVSSVHWISAWSGNLLDHVEDLAKTLQHPDGLKSGGILTPPSALTKVKRFFQSNILSLIILFIMLGAGYFVYSLFQKMSPVTPQVALPMSEFSKSDLSLRGSADRSAIMGQMSSYKYMLMFAPANQNGAQTLRNVRFRIELEDGQQYTTQSTGGVASFRFESMALVPSIELIIIDENEQQFGPYTFSLQDINQTQQQQSQNKQNIENQKHLAKWKLKVANKNLFNQCSRLFDNGFSYCNVTSQGFSGNYTDMVQRIRIEVADTDLVYDIDPNETSSKGIGIRLNNSGDINKPNYIFPFPLEALKYQVTFSDGEQSDVISHDRNPRFEQEIKDKVHKFVSANEQAPDIYAVLDINNKRWDPTAYSSRITLISIVGNDVVSIKWRTSSQTEDKISEQNFSSTMHWRSGSDTKLFGDIGSDSELYVRYSYVNGDEKEIVYLPDWQGWQLD